MVLNNFGYVTNACRVKVKDGAVGIGAIDRNACEPHEVSRYTLFELPPCVFYILLMWGWETVYFHS